jgi:hypothetical protein
MRKAFWLLKTHHVRLWLASMPEEHNNLDICKAIAMTLELGDASTSEDLWSTYWTAILGMGAGMDGFPRYRRGREIKRTNRRMFSDDDIVDVMWEHMKFLNKIQSNQERKYDFFTSHDQIFKHIIDLGEKLLRMKKKGKWNGNHVDGVPEMNPNNLE